MPKVIVRIKGGLGNQLFCYAAARRLAVMNNADLIIDDVTGFVHDHLYRRQYALDHFYIKARKATAKERLEPFGRYRRAFAKIVCKNRCFSNRYYLEQDQIGFDERLLDFKVKGTVYLDGYWQSEKYFKDVEQTIREDLFIRSPVDSHNQYIAKKINSYISSVALHVRWFDPAGNSSVHNVSNDYYRRAMAYIDDKIDSPHYFLFSDDHEAVRKLLALPEGRVTFITHNKYDEDAYADLWLMTLCRHFITANSTFSWWGAWLGGGANKIVVTPDLNISGKTSWGFKGLIPDEWIKL